MKIAESDHRADLETLLRHLPQRAHRGVIHVGAHKGEEADVYLDAGFAPVVLVEANPELAADLASRFAGDSRVRTVHCAVTDREGDVELYVHTSRTGSVEPASLLPMKRFREIVKTLHTPHTVRVPGCTLDSLLQANGLRPEEFGLLNVDVQGAELLVLKGARRTLQTLPAVICEVTLLELYEGAPHERDVTAFLAGYGYAAVDAVYHTLYDEHSVFPAWGEKLFVKRGAGAG